MHRSINMYSRCLIALLLLVSLSTTTFGTQQSRPSPPAGVAMLATMYPHTMRWGELVLYADWVGLPSIVDQETVVTAYSKYRKQITKIEDEQLTKLWDSAIAAASYDEHGNSNPEHIERFWFANETMNAHVVQAENKFWSSFETVFDVDSKEFKTIQKIRRRRQRDVCSRASVFRIVPESKVDLFSIIEFADICDTIKLNSQQQLLLDDYEKIMTTMMKRVWKQVMEYQHKYSVKLAIGYTDKTRSERNRARAALCKNINGIVSTHEETLESLKGLLDEDSWSQLEHQWRIAAYPNVFPNRWSADDVIKPIIESDTLAAPQRVILDDIILEYQIEMERLSVKIIKQVHAWHQERCQLKPHHPNESEMIRDEFYAMDVKRMQLSRTTIDLIFSELTDRQQVAFSKFRQKWNIETAKVRSNWLGYGTP